MESQLDQLAALFGLVGDDPQRVQAFGTGRGSWVKRPLRRDDLQAHLDGKGDGVGLPPLRRDGTCWFAAIDLDEPDFAAASAMQRFIPGHSWIEKSRSGNAHVWVFFTAPIQAWLVRGILQQAVLAAGKEHVEIFPKQHRLLEGMLGNYINLPYFGDTRKILFAEPTQPYLGLDEFIERASDWRNEPEEWRRRAAWLQVEDPALAEKRSGDKAEFGHGKNLHMCAEYIIANCEDNPVVEGHRNAVFFALAKQLSHYEGFDHDEVWEMLLDVNNHSPDPAPESEIRRILHNAERGRYTSTQCDDPLVAPYCHPACPIANPRN